MTVNFAFGWGTPTRPILAATPPIVTASPARGAHDESVGDGSHRRTRGETDVLSFGRRQAALGLGDTDADYQHSDPGPSRRGAVRQLQVDLAALGFFPAGQRATGGYFRITRMAVLAFQSRNGLPATGKADDATRTAIARLLATSPVCPAPRPVPAPRPMPRPAPEPSPVSPPRVPSVSPVGQAGIARLERMSHSELARLGATDKKAFFDALRPSAEAAERVYGVPAEVTLAQIALESGYGKSVPGGTSFNFFGIKGQGPAGSVRQSSYEKNRTQKKVSTFACYHNFHEAIMAHGQLFQKAYYKKAMLQVAGGNKDPQDFFRNIEGVYHQDGHTYTRQAMGIIQRFGLA